MQVAEQDLCDEQSWPDKDRGLVCGDCKVLVDKFKSKYKTCNGYCAQLDRSCVGAWDEIDDTCTEKGQMGCDEELDTSDVICECSPQMSPKKQEGLCDEQSWPD